MAQRRRRLADELCDDGSEREQGHQRDDAQRHDAVDTPHAEDVRFNVRQVKRKGESGKSGNEQQAVRAQATRGRP